MQLSDEERERIRMSEEYRAEVRKAMAGPKESSGAWLLDKLAMPALFLVASGIGVPWILGNIEQDRREFDLQSKLIEQIVADDAAVQASSQRFRGAIGDYRTALLDNELQKRLVEVRKLDKDAAQARRIEIHDDLTRSRAAYFEAHNAAVDANNKFYIEYRGNVEWIKLHYPEKAPLDEYMKASRNERQAATAGLNQFQNDAAKIHNDAVAEFVKCADVDNCQAVFDAANAKVAEHRAKVPEFTAWNAAREKLVLFISETEPRM